MIIQVQLALVFFSTLFVVLRNATTPSSTAVSSNPSCLQYKGHSVHALSANNYLNFFAIAGGEATASQCSELIKAMDAVIAQHPYVKAGLALKNRRIILSPNNDVGMDHMYDAQYKANYRIYALGKSALKSPAHLETKLRELFFYGACHAYQLSFDGKSISRQPFHDHADKIKLEKALERGYKNIQAYRKTLHELNRKRDARSIALRQQITDLQQHYTYPTKTDQNGHPLYKGIDPLLAALIETETMFNPAWIDELKKINGGEYLLSLRLALLYSEIPQPIINEFFPALKTYTDKITQVAINNVQNDVFTPPDKRLYTMDDFQQALYDDEANMGLRYK